MLIKLIANPVSGSNAQSRIEQAKVCLENFGAEVDVHLTAARGDARAAAAMAAESGFERIVAAGGDGTLNEVVNGVYPTPVPVAFLPLGTVNVFAFEANIPRSIQNACRLAVLGRPRRVSLGRINGELFLLMASAGWDADAVFRLRPGLKRLFGRLAYGVSALEALAIRSPAVVDITFPGQKQVTGYGVVISNSRYYGGRYRVTPNASIFSDTLEVCVLKRPGRLALVNFVIHLALHVPLPHSLADFYSVRSLAVAGGDVRVQVDGDAWGTLPVQVDSLPEAVNMILPEQSG